MKKTRFFNFILILAIAVSLVIFSRAICDDEASFDALCNFTLAQHHELFSDIFSQKGVLYADNRAAFSSPQVISYLARQEKSPPPIS